VNGALRCVGYQALRHYDFSNIKFRFVFFMNVNFYFQVVDLQIVARGSLMHAASC